MNREVVFRRVARSEYDEAEAWYEGEQPRLRIQIGSRRLTFAGRDLAYLDRQYEERMGGSGGYINNHQICHSNYPT